MFYLTTHSTQLFTVMWLWAYGKVPFSGRERKPAAATTLATLISTRDCYMHHATHRMAYNGICYTSRGTLAGIEK